MTYTADVLTRRRRLIVAACLLLALVAGAVVVVHLPGVQRAAWQRVTAAVFEASGFQVSADHVRLSYFPGRFEASDLRVVTETGTLATAQRIAVGWSWLGLAGEPRRIDLVEIHEPVVDLRHLPAAEPVEAGAAGSPAEWLGVVDIGDLRLIGGGAGGDLADLQWSVHELGIAGRLQGRVAVVNVTAEELSAVRLGRELRLGPLQVAADIDDKGVSLDRCEVDGTAVRAVLDDARLDWDGELHARTALSAEVELAEVLEWWGPSIQEQVPVAGRALIEGGLSWSGGDAVELELRHTGEPIRVAGMAIDGVEVSGNPTDLVLTAAGGSWGRARAALVGMDRVDVAIELDHAVLDSLNPLIPHDAPFRVPRGVIADGRLNAAVPLPFVATAVTGTADMRLSWWDGEMVLKASGDLDEVVIERAVVSMPGGRASIEGIVEPQGRVAVDVDLDAPDPGRLAASLARWWPMARDFGIAGGALEGGMKIGGTLEHLVVEGQMTWDHPAAMKMRHTRLDVEVSGNPGRLEWGVVGQLTADAIFELVGSTTVADMRSEARLSFDAGSIELVTRAVGVEVFSDLGGSCSGEADLIWDGHRWGIDGVIEVEDLAWDGWTVDSGRFSLSARPDRVEVKDVELAFGGGRIRGRASVPLSSFDEDLSGHLSVNGLEVARLPFDIPAPASGIVTADLGVSGTPARPLLDASFAWEASDAAGPLRSVALRAALRDGVIRVASELVESAAGPVVLDGSLPLGQLTRPEWVWPDAPDGPLRLQAHAQDLSSAPLLAVLGISDLGMELTTDVDLDVRWDLLDPEQRFVNLRIDELTLANELERLVTDGPVVVSWSGDRIVAEDLVLVGARSRIEAGGHYDIGESALVADGELVLDPQIARLLPYPVHIRGPIRAGVHVSGPIDSLSGTLKVDHGGGRIVLRDPPVELGDLELEASLANGVVSVRNGSATLNRGTVVVGGGWDPVHGQGLILELEEVAFLLPHGILSRWNGLLALEPDDEALVRVAGDLVLDGGLWDRPVDYVGMAFGPSDSGPAGEDPMHDVLLDVDVSGRGGVHVDNNLGLFDVTWDRLHVGGTAAMPILEGSVRIASGGVLGFLGSPIEVRRGVVEFSGEAGEDPRIEIVPMDDVAAFGDQQGAGLDTTMLATKTLARGIGSALGLENETLQPAEIAVETETDPGSRFAVGQRLSRNLALIVTTDLSNVQDYQTMLQVWNVRGLPGLALQVFQETEDGVQGAAVIERVQWGGTIATDDRPSIHKVKLEGKWPISKRKLKKSAGLSKGQPYDPFLLFAGGLRMEQRLAEAGYFEAVVEGRAEGDTRLPALHFECEPGPFQAFDFEGDRLPAALRRQAISMYVPPPLEGPALRSIALTIRRHLAVKGYPDAEVSVTRVEDRIVTAVASGERHELEGPVVNGLTAAAARQVELLLGDPAELAALAEDPQRGEAIVRRLLRTQGYFNVESVSLRIEAMDAKRSVVHLDVEPGTQERIAEIGVAGSDPLSMIDADEIAISEGMALERARVNAAAISIRRAYQNEGYPDVEIHTWLEELEDGDWKLWVELDPGTQRRVGEVRLNGLRNLSESVVEKGLVVEEGELLRTTDVDESAVRLATFAPVERVDIRTAPQSGGRARIEVDIEEKPRWTVGAGARWRSDRGLEALVDLRDDNLFGRGFGLNLRGRWEKTEQQWSLIAALPASPGGRFSTSLSGSYFEGDAKVDPTWLREETKKLTLEGTFRLFPETLLRAYYKYANTFIFEKEPDPRDPFEDEIITSTVGSQYITDRLDNPFDPRKGWAFAIDASWSTSYLGSDLDTVRSLASSSLALEPRAGWTWAQSLRIGVAEPLQGTLLDPQQRFFAGGQASVRGFERDSVGPLRPGNDGTLIGAGGGALFVLNEELRVPVWNSLRVAVFADVGQVWESWTAADFSFSVGAGFGIRYATPIGPLWADIAWPVANKGISEGYRVYFGLGRPF